MSNVEYVYAVCMNQNDNIFPIDSIHIWNECMLRMGSTKKKPECKMNYLNLIFELNR